MNEIQGKANIYYEHLPKMLVSAIQDEGYFCMRYFKEIVGHGSNQREVISFSCHNRKVKGGAVHVFEGKELRELEISAIVEVYEVGPETSKVSIFGEGHGAWRKVIEIVRATGYVEFDNEKKKPRSLIWRKDFLEYKKLSEKVKIIFFEAMAVYGSIPDNPKDMRGSIESFLVMTPRNIDDKAEKKGLFMEYCSQEKNWKGEATETSKRRDKPIRKNVRGFDVDTLRKFYDNNIKQ